jgi:hypothetical protein
MKVVARCKKHAGAQVLLLEATLGYLDAEGAQVQNNEVPVAEIHLDLGNTYCTVDDPFNHDIVFVVITEDGHWLCNAD